ncbi:MAG: hypothetical protein KF715_11685 [Candidatus Didemnitutus sp.]|nr:hypothetical protein [Candidatus Didemnitutus sp.]
MAILFVAGLTATLFVVLRLRTKKPHGPAELQRLRDHIAWLEDRQRHANEKHWDATMKARIAAQLGQARRELAAGESGSPAS